MNCEMEKISDILTLSVHGSVKFQDLETKASTLMRKADQFAQGRIIFLSSEVDLRKSPDIKIVCTLKSGELDFDKNDYQTTVLKGIIAVIQLLRGTIDDLVQ